MDLMFVDEVKPKDDTIPQLTGEQLQKLLLFKEQLGVPDHMWQLVVDTFDLQNGGTIHFIRKARQETLDKLQLKVERITCGKDGAKIGLLDIISHSATVNKANGNELSFKLSADGGRLTSGKTLYAELFNIDRIDREYDQSDQSELEEGKDIRSFKSPQESYTIAMVLGKESESIFKKEFKETIECSEFDFSLRYGVSCPAARNVYGV